MTVTREQAEKMLRNDLKRYEGFVNSFLESHSISVNQSQYDALVSFTYNLGNVWVSTPTFQLKTYLINGINNYTDEQITTAFTNWCKDGAGNVLPGLVTRRKKEAAYFLRERNIETEAPRIHAWISDDKMKDVPNNFKLGKMYYLCYELLDANGNRFESGNDNYVVTETLYGPDGGVANTCDYENSNNNWIGYSSYDAGTYKGVVKISGAYEGSVEVSYKVNEIVPQARAWASKSKMGQTANTFAKDEMCYLCYELRDKYTEKKLNETIEMDYKVTETIYKPDGSVAYTYTYENSDYNWIGYRVPTGGNYKCVVTISGRYNGSVDAQFTVVIPTPKPTATPTIKPTATPILRPTTTPTIKPTATLTLRPTATPTIKPTITPIQRPTATPEETDGSLDEQIEDSDDYDTFVSEDEETLQEGDTFKVKSEIYEVTDASDTPTVELLTIEKKTIKDVSVPAAVKYEGITYKVTGIAKNAFKNQKNITSLTIGSNVTYIGSYAFYKNSKLKTINIQSKKLKTIQKRAFFGLPKKVTVKVPSSKKETYKKMLKNAGLGKR